MACKRLAEGLQGQVEGFENQPAGSEGQRRVLDAGQYAVGSQSQLKGTEGQQDESAVICVAKICYHRYRNEIK